MPLEKILLESGGEMKHTIQTLARRIVNAVQAEAGKIPDLDNGAIRLLFVPKCGTADGYFGHFGLDCELGLVFPIKEGASHTRPAKWRGKEDRKECNCSGYAELKIQGCAYAHNHDLGQRSCDMPEEAVTWGRTNDRGCVVYDVYTTDTESLSVADNPTPMHAFRVYVAVSGATGDEDEQCALAAGYALQWWCDTSLGGHPEKYLYSLTGPR
jgi:hypothetical protein